MAVNYQLELERELQKNEGKTPRLLLHCCCAPCSSYVLEYLSPHFSITAHYYNPNIDTPEEYAHRARELSRFVQEMPLPGAVDVLAEPYTPAEFYAAVKGLEDIPEGGRRCYECYRLRLRRAAQAAALVQGAGTGAIRAALAALLKPGQRLLVHDAPVYPTTRVIIEQMGLTLITADFNDLSALKQVVDEQQPDAALVQHTRQQPQDRYVLADVLATLRAAGVPALTDDNYAVMKVARIGCECGANVSTFSCFKLFGPEGVGAVVGDADVINRIRATLYSGGSQIQGAQALEVLRGLVFAPVMHAVQAGVSERLLALLNGGAVAEVKSAVIANAQSKVLIVEFHQPIAARVLEEAQKRGALPYPVGAESKYEIPPLFYRLSGTFRQANPQLEHCAIRINPNRGGEETILRILRESIASI